MCVHVELPSTVLLLGVSILLVPMVNFHKNTITITIVCTHEDDGSIPRTFMVEMGRHSAIVTIFGSRDLVQNFFIVICSVLKMTPSLSLKYVLDIDLDRS